MIDDVLGVLGAAVGIGSLICTAVWAVSKIDRTTAVLGAKIDNLSGSVTKLERGIESLRDEINDVDSRVTHIEAINGHSRRERAK